MARRYSAQQNRARRIAEDKDLDFSPPLIRGSRSSSRTSRSSSRASHNTSRSRRSGGSRRQRLPRREPVASKSPLRRPATDDGAKSEAASLQLEHEKLREELRQAQKAVELCRSEVLAQRSETEKTIERCRAELSAEQSERESNEATMRRGWWRERDELQAELSKKVAAMASAEERAARLAEQGSASTAAAERAELHAVELCREELHAQQSECEALSERLVAEASTRQLQLDDMQNKLFQAESRSATLEAECASIHSLLGMADADGSASGATPTIGCDDEPSIREVPLNVSASGASAAPLHRRLAAELRRRAQAEAQVELLQRERDAIWEQLSTEESKRALVEAQAVAFEKEWDALRERLAAERLKREKAEEEKSFLTERLLDAAAGQQAAAAAVAAAEFAMAQAHASSTAPAEGEGSRLAEGLRDSLRAEEAMRRQAETQVAAMKEQLDELSKQLASMEAAEVLNQVVERVLLQHVNLDRDNLNVTPGAGRVFLLEQMAAERARAEQAEGRATALEQRLVPVMQAAQQQIEAFRQDCLALQGKLEAEERLHKNSAAEADALRDELLALRPQLEKETQKLREDCLALQCQLEEEVRWREEAQAQVAELERACVQEREAVVAAKRAAQRQVDTVREDSLALWGRLEAEQSQRQHDEAKAAAVERDARHLIRTFKEDCLNLESKVQAIETAAQRQVETFSDDCLVLRGRLKVEEGRTEAEESRAATLSWTAHQSQLQTEAFEQGSELLGREVEELEQAAEQQMADFAEDRLAQEARLRHERWLCDEMQSKLQVMERAAERQLATHSDDQAMLHSRLQAEQSLRLGLEQQLAAAKLESCRATESVLSEETQCAVLERQATASRLDACRAAEMLQAAETLHAEHQTAEAHWSSLEEQLAASGLRASRAADDLRAELQAEESKCTSLRQQLMACRVELVDSNRAAENAQALDNHCMSLEVQLSAVRIETSKAADKMCEELQEESGQRESLEQQLEASRIELRRAAHELQVSHRHCTSLEHQLSSAQLETSRAVEQMQAELEAEHGQCTSLEDQLAAARLELRRAAEDLQASHADAASLGRQVSSAQLETFRGAKQVQAELEAAQSLPQSITHQNAGARVDSTKAAATLLEELQEAHSAVEQRSLAQVADAEAARQVASHQIDSLREDCRELKTLLMEEEARREAHMVQQSEVIQKSVEEHVLARTTRLVEELSELEELAVEEDERMAEDQQRIEILEQALSARIRAQAQSENMVAALQRECEALRSEAAARKAATERTAVLLQYEMVTADALQSELLSGTAESQCAVNRLQRECEALQTELATAVSHRAGPVQAAAGETGGAASSTSDSGISLHMMAPAVQVAAFRKRLATADVCSASKMEMQIEKQKQLILLAIGRHRTMDN